MSKKLYVGSLAWATTDQGLREAFETVGPVVEAIVLMDKVRNRSRGFGFVTMENDADGDTAIAKFNQNEMLDGRKLVVNEARPPQENGGGRGDYRGGYQDRGPRSYDERPHHTSHAPAAEAPMAEGEMGDEEEAA